MVPAAVNATSSTDYLEKRHNYLGPACSPQLIGVTATSNPRSSNSSTRFSTNRESGARAPPGSLGEHVAPLPLFGGKRRVAIGRTGRLGLLTAALARPKGASPSSSLQEGRGPRAGAHA
jgi:hypothetical protein